MCMMCSCIVPEGVTFAQPYQASLSRDTQPTACPFCLGMHDNRALAVGLLLGMGLFAYSAWCYALLSPWVMQDHLTGKQYLGWKAIRDEQARLQEQLANQRLPPPPSRPTEDARPSHREREREREPRRDRERERPHSSRDQHRSRQPSDREAENGRRSSSHSHRERSPTRSGCMCMCQWTWRATIHQLGAFPFLLKCMFSC